MASGVPTKGCKQKTYEIRFRLDRGCLAAERDQTGMESLKMVVARGQGDEAVEIEKMGLSEFRSLCVELVGFGGMREKEGK